VCGYVLAPRVRTLRKKKEPPKLEVALHLVGGSTHDEE